jgi:hypothetical protein
MTSGFSVGAGESEDAGDGVSVGEAIKGVFVGDGCATFPLQARSNIVDKMSIAVLIFFELVMVIQPLIDRIWQGI